MATKWTKPISRKITLPNGEVRIVEFGETGVSIRKPRFKPLVIPYDQLEGFSTEKSLILHTQHWGTLKAELLPHGVHYAQQGKRPIEALIPHGIAFQKAVDLKLAEERAQKGGSRKARRR